jgi:hypothetical protein
MSKQTTLNPLEDIANIIETLQSIYEEDTFSSDKKRQLIHQILNRFISTPQKINSHDMSVQVRTQQKMTDPLTPQEQKILKDNYSGQDLNTMLEANPDEVRGLIQQYNLMAKSGLPSPSKGGLPSPKGSTSTTSTAKAPAKKPIKMSEKGNLSVWLNSKQLGAKGFGNAIIYKNKDQNWVFSILNKNQDGTTGSGSLNDFRLAKEGNKLVLVAVLADDLSKQVADQDARDFLSELGANDISSLTISPHIAQTNTTDELSPQTNSDEELTQEELRQIVNDAEKEKRSIISKILHPTIFTKRGNQ